MLWHYIINLTGQNNSLKLLFSLQLQKTFAMGVIHNLYLYENKILLPLYTITVSVKRNRISQICTFFCDIIREWTPKKDSRVFKIILFEIYKSKISHPGIEQSSNLHKQAIAVRIPVAFFHGHKKKESELNELYTSNGEV